MRVCVLISRDVGLWNCGTSKVGQYVPEKRMKGWCFAVSASESELMDCSEEASREGNFLDWQASAGADKKSRTYLKN